MRPPWNGWSGAQIAKRVGPTLEAAGFTRPSGTFRRRSGDGDAIVLGFRGSTSSGDWLGRPRRAGRPPKLSDAEGR